jgi:hypothetical protein
MGCDWFVPGEAGANFQSRSESMAAAVRGGTSHTTFTFIRSSILLIVTSSATALKVILVNG